MTNSIIDYITKHGKIKKTVLINRFCGKSVRKMITDGQLIVHEGYVYLKQGVTL